MLTLVLLALFSQQLDDEAARSPERRPLTVGDAFFSIEGVTARAAP